MNMMSTFIKPMHPEGWRFVGVFAAVTLVLFWLWEPLGWVGAGLTVWCYYFFRDPVRIVPQTPGLIVSPADGVVSLIEPAVPPPGLDMPQVALLRVSVFMSVFNCHVNRAPLAGTVGAVAYHKGQFLNASVDKASALNERNAIRIDDAEGRQVAVVQIAGLVARRILCWARPGAALRRGERFGLIRFGSRLDVYLPRDAVVQVALGQTMIAGETVIARTSAGTTAEHGRPE
jgi:phosphatidylserine decarboxylase